MSAPVCHIPPANPNITQPGPKPLPSIPDPGPDINSLLASVLALKMIVERITGKDPLDNGTLNGFRIKPDPNKKEQWTEQSRVVEKVKVYQNNDPSTGNFVEIERINQLTMRDKATGQTWTWDRDRK